MAGEAAPEVDAGPAVAAPYLALIAGWTDAIGYLQGHAFAANMTGNTVLLGISLAAAQWRAAGWRAAIIAAYCLGLLTARLMVEARRGAVAAMLPAAVLIGYCAFAQVMPRDLLLLAVALGLQNASMTRFGGTRMNTTFLTGDLERLAEGVAGWLRRGRQAEGVGPVPWLWLAYAAGALLGAGAEAWLPYPLLVPALLLAAGAALLSFWRQRQRPSAAGDKP